MGVKLHKIESSELVLFKGMAKGDVGVIVGSEYHDVVVLKLLGREDKVISLSGDSWSSLAQNTLEVRLLAKGTLLQVT